jgi:hypothetical protein
MDYVRPEELDERVTRSAPEADIGWMAFTKPKSGNDKTGREYHTIEKSRQRIWIVKSPLDTVGMFREVE